MAVASTDTLKEPADEVPSSGDNTRNPIFNSVKKLREFWTKWQRKESKVLNGSVKDPSSYQDDIAPSKLFSHLSEPVLEGGMSSKYDRRGSMPGVRAMGGRYRKLRELARKVSSRFSQSDNDPDFYREKDCADSSLDSAQDPFLKACTRDVSSYGSYYGSKARDFSAYGPMFGSSCSSVTESTMSAYEGVSLEIAHRLQNHTYRCKDRQSTAFPTSLFRKSSLELSRSCYRRLKSSTCEDSDDIQ